ncbi:hypothetical protein N7490_001498 [Penicillium lividum]|nr:hypothetical protein N7490_001498 [Penicillium lividum]
MNYRQGHTKSRHGCTACKTRRCDELRPICSNCDQRRETCVYPGLGPHFFAINTRRPQKKARPPPEDQPQTAPDAQIFIPDAWTSHSPGSSILISSFPSLDMTQLELVLQWIKHTHKFAVRNEATRKVWEMPVLEEALKAPFLMHGILALSAMHLSHLRQDERHVMWLDIAIAHKNTALVMFSGQLRNISQTNAKAMMIFAGLAFAFSLASALKMESKEDGPGLDALTNVFVLARGVQAVLDVEGEFLRQSNFAPLLNVTTPEVDIPDHFYAAMDRLEQLKLQYHQMDPDVDHGSYTRNINQLRDLAVFSYAEPTSMTMAAGWAIRAPQKYLDDLRAHKPFALVVLAHYCVFLHMAQGNWSIGCWGRRVLEEIIQILDPHWKPHIEWAVLNVLSG